MEIIKRHPYISIGALLAGVAAIIIVNSGSGGAGNIAGVDPNAVAAATALQQSQLQQQTQMAGINAGLAAQSSDNATKLALTDLQGKYSYDIASLAASVQEFQIGSDAQTHQLDSTLTAQSTQAEYKKQIEIQTIQSNQAVLTTQAVANALVAQSANQAAVSMAAINAANKCHGLGCIFG